MREIGNHALIKKVLIEESTKELREYYGNTELSNEIEEEDILVDIANEISAIARPICARPD